MDILVKRFTVRHDGKHYGPGDVIYNVPNVSGKKMVDESNGEMEKLPAQETQEPSQNQEAEKNGVLPPVDPKQTVGAGKK